MQPSNEYLWRISGEALSLCYRAAPGYEARLTPGASLVLSGEKVPDLNYAIVDAGPMAEEHLREYIQLAESRDVPLLVLLTHEASPRLSPVARELGLQFLEDFPLMVYRPVNPSAETGVFQVWRVEKEEDVRISNSLAATAFGMEEEALNRAFSPDYIQGPGVDLFMAAKDGEVISSVQTTRAGPITGIWAMATSPDQQRKGAGRALLNYAIYYHFSRGVEYFYLEATPAGKPLYSKIGFQTVSEAQVWLLKEK
ncbi:MAG: GNAT family N-acetyltransferase [Dehalococcoidales bacterium]|nr:GNAT family N-acetyltransferase [Dehalococcoidales bacterium]